MNTRDINEFIEEAEVPFSMTMVRIPGGTFVPEGSSKSVKVGGFWLGKFEVTWNQYEAFWMNYDLDSDGVTSPSIPFEPPDRGMGRGDHAAMSVHPAAVGMFCRWLKKQTGWTFRLPTESEWEYACRAGGGVKPPDPIGDYAWHRGNSIPKGKKPPKSKEPETWYRKTPVIQPCPKNQRVGRKKPNAWDLHDMLGGVWEYVAVPSKNGRAPDSIVRGGSWNDPPDLIRAGARLKGSPREWNKGDPNRPKGISWYVDAPFVGFRLAADGPPPGK